MLILGARRFIQASFSSEEELEGVVVDNSELIFGPSSIYFPKALISTTDGTGTVPDGYVIDLASRRWYIVEAELSRHSVWSHIAPQVAKQLIAAINPNSRQLLVDLAVESVKDDPALLEKFQEEDIAEIDIRRALDEILRGEPVIGMPIDAVKNDLRDWAQTLKVDVKLWIVRKYVEFGNPENIIYEVPEEYRPALDTEEEATRVSKGVAHYDVTVGDLIDAGVLEPGQVLVMRYKPRGGEQCSYHGTVQSDGSVEVLGKTFSSPS